MVMRNYTALEVNFMNGHKLLQSYDVAVIEVVQAGDLTPVQIEQIDLLRRELEKRLGAAVAAPDVHPGSILLGGGKIG